MDRVTPYVVAVASEKGGVGKTTIATNLAVYLKALREDLEVTVASFDNHFSVDNMFAIGRHRGTSVAGLFEGTPAADLVQMGEYGVQFLASERHLEPPDGDLCRLAGLLADSRLPGVLVLDTRPILDYFTHSALHAADLVLAPVKDRPSLVNAAAIKSAMIESGGEPERLWLVPSLIDARLRLRPEVGMADFLSFSAQERGYQVVDTFIAKSPKVEGLATGFSSRIYPVLTHARTTAVHRQLRELAAFVLGKFDAAETFRCAGRSRAAADLEDVPPARRRRLLDECPFCSDRTEPEEGLLLQDLRSRRRALLHPECLHTLLPEGVIEEGGEGGMLAITFGGPGLLGLESALSLILYDEEGEERTSLQPEGTEAERFLELWETVCGRSVEEAYREVLAVRLEPEAAGHPLGEEGYKRFNGLRRKIVREALLKYL